MADSILCPLGIPVCAPRLCYFASLRPLVAAYLYQALMLLQGPDEHLVGAGNGEDNHWHSLSRHSKHDPAVHLSGIVGTRNVVEQEATGKFVFFAAIGPEVGQDDVAPRRDGSDALFAVQLTATS